MDKENLLKIPFFHKSHYETLKRKVIQYCKIDLDEMFEKDITKTDEKIK